MPGRIRSQREFFDMVPQLVFENEGRTAKEYAKMALERGYRSVAEKVTPEESLATTLHQQFRKRHLPQLSRVRDRDGVWRYYKWDSAV